MAFRIMIARKSFLIVVFQLISQIAGWIGLVFLARNWGNDTAVAALGIVTYTISLLAIFNIFADLGFSRAHVKRISEGKDLGTCIGTYAMIKLLLIGLMVTIIFIYRLLFYQADSSPTQESVLTIITLYYIFSNLTFIATVTFEGTKEIAKRSIVQIFASLKMPLMIFVALAGVTGIYIKDKGWVHSPTRIDWPEFLKPLQQFTADHAIGSFAMTYAFAMIFTFIVAMWLLRKYPIKRPSREYFISYFRFALPTIIASVVGILSLNIDKIMIGIFYSELEVGYYSGAQTVITIVSSLYLAVGIVLFPTVSGYHSKMKIEKINNKVREAERYISMIVVPPLIFIMVLPTPIISTILSTDFLPATSVLVVMALYTFFYSLGRPFVTLLTGMDKPGIATKIGITVCLANIPLNILFIPKNGLLSPLGINGPTGAAVATTLSVLIGFIGYRLAAKKLSGIKLLQFHTPRHIISGLAMGGVLYYIAEKTNLFPNKYWYVLLFFLGIGLSVYLGVLVLLREFKKKDMLFFLDVLSPKKMVKYVTTEFKNKEEK